jgi:hypothetical protein
VANPVGPVQSIDNRHLKPFEHSGVHDWGLEPFPASRPAGPLVQGQPRPLRTGLRLERRGHRSLLIAVITEPVTQAARAFSSLVATWPCRNSAIFPSSGRWVVSMRSAHQYATRFVANRLARSQ